MFSLSHAVVNLVAAQKLDRAIPHVHEIHEVTAPAVLFRPVSENSRDPHPNLFHQIPKRPEAHWCLLWVCECAWAVMAYMPVSYLKILQKIEMGKRACVFQNIGDHRSLWTLTTCKVSPVRCHTFGKKWDVRWRGRGTTGALIYWTNLILNVYILWQYGVSPVVLALFCAAAKSVTAWLNHKKIYFYKSFK
ncbi:hypothetical protein EVAR_5702_1 [Eumeta japonica]|uniref:Uncharacterized protein n=1 Tax=Eumeta variegata TaxID=151549 RepID=A0A4C1T7J9_EUMVA|nr:hypothetical protein EVAR_5702_1 [Eumeta japonica]